MFALADDLIGKSNGRIFTAGRSNTAGDLDKFVSGTIEKAKMGYLRARLEPLRNGAAHVVHAISASPRDRGVEGVPQGGALRLADRKRDRVLGSRKIPLGDFGSQPSLLVGCQGNVHAATVAELPRLSQPDSEPATFESSVDQVKAVNRSVP
jgi:hypothetical protein